MTDEARGHPEFGTAMRGYDRPQVDGYVASLLARVAEAQERARVAESQLGLGAPANIGPRVTEIFDLALAEANELRDRARTEADELLAGARRRADELVAAAERDAGEVMVQARAQREEVLAELDRERELADAQVVALERRKAKLVDELRRLQGALGSAADSVGEGATEAPDWNEAGETRTMELPIELPPSDTDPPAPDR